MMVSACSSCGCWIHSTFRSLTTGKQYLPQGLKWSVEGTSHLRFVVRPRNASDKSPTRQSILKAYNRFQSAKDLPYHSLDNIRRIEKDGNYHWKVEWKEKEEEERGTRIAAPKEIIILYPDIPKLLHQDASDLTILNQKRSVWIGGDFAGELTEDTLPAILEKIPANPPNRQVYKRSGEHIRIERQYQGMLRQKPQVWDHIWDNLVALEDPEIVNERALLGTATLRDWVMGGYLTSRLYVEEQEDGKSFLFLRPLQNDDLATSDRRYILQVDETDDEKMREIKEHRLLLVRQELHRLRYLAGLHHPYQFDASEIEQKTPTQKRMSRIRDKLGHHKRKRKFFGT